MNSAKISQKWWEISPWWILGPVFATFTIVVGTYLAAFKSASISEHPEHWGQFGDYIGGILNPLVAFAALTLLAISVQLQRTELAATRNELSATAESQKKQVRLSALTAIMNALAEEANMHRTHLQYLTAQIPEQKSVYRTYQNDIINKLDGTAGRYHAHENMRSIDAVHPIIDLDGTPLTKSKLETKLANLNKRIEDLMNRRSKYQEAITDLM